MAALDADKLTWAALLGRWVEFAQSALALPSDAAGRAMRDSVSDLITLQAVTMALGELDRLDVAERALGLDRARILIDRHEQALKQRYADQAMPSAMAELMEDARSALITAETL